MLLFRTFCVFSWPIRDRGISLFILVPKMQARAWTVHGGPYYFTSVSTPHRMTYIPASAFFLTLYSITIFIDCKLLIFSLLLKRRSYSRLKDSFFRLFSNTFLPIAGGWGGGGVSLYVLPAIIILSKKYLKFTDFSLKFY